MSARPRVGISACLLGAPVRYDGTDKGRAFPVPELLGRVEWVPVCPEVEVGMPVPREPVRLERRGGRIRMIGVESRADHTDAMETWARNRAARLAALGLAAFVLKANSPSCGLDTVPLVQATGSPLTSTSGLFAVALRAALPTLPIEDELRLADPAIRAAFVEEVLKLPRTEPEQNRATS
jgi:uncharacterized protein YbbK (DUF523 family)